MSMARHERVAIGRQVTMSTEKRRRLNVEQAITGSDGSPTFRKNRRAQPIERDLDGIPDDNPNGVCHSLPYHVVYLTCILTKVAQPPSLAECEDIVEGALQQHSDVFNPTPEITAHHLLSTVVSAVRSNGGSVGECCVAADIFAYMFSSQSLFDIGQYLKEHRMWTTVARARRATISSGQAAGNKHPWTAGTPATYNVQYNSFLDIVDLVMSFGVPHSQSSLLRMYTCMETYQKFDNMGHGLADDGDLAKSMSERAQQHGLSGFGDTAAHGPAADGFLNAAIDYIGSGRAEDEFHSFRHLLQELLYIGSGLTSIASWGDGALMCLLHSEWCMKYVMLRA